MGDEPGPLLVVGGHEEKDGCPVILERLVELAGGSRAVIAVVPTASTAPDRAAVPYERALTRLGARKVVPVWIDRRAEADAWRPDGERKDITALFFTGGDQLRITSTLGGTAFHRWLVERHRAGLVVAGTSAGASAMSDTMIVAGERDESPTLNTVELAVGMGFWPGVVVDQHFSERGRIGRLLSALAQNPAVLGVGIDENTAIEVDFRREAFLVWGDGIVTVLDGTRITHTNASESKPTQALMLSDVLVHILPQGWAYEWARRKPFAVETVKEGVR